MPADFSPSLTAEQHRLDNGLRVNLHHDSALPLVAINLWYHVGSRNERPGRTGLAHLFEHMLFQGSQHVGTNDHFRYVQQVGGVANGSTWYDRTNYFETLPAHHLELGLWLESDRMGFLLPAITPEKLENQRQVVMNERRQRIDNQPYGRAFERLQELLYPPGHPYRWPVIGYMEDIAAASLDDVSAFFRTYYAPNNAVLSLAGDLDSGQAVAQVERYFGPIAPGPEAPPVEIPSPPDYETRRETLEDEVQLARIYIAFQTPRYGLRAWYAADLLAGVLTGGRSSILFRDLVYERQLAREVDAAVFPTELGGTLVLIATARPETAAEQLEEALFDHLRRVRGEPVAQAEVERARNRLLTAYLADLQRLETRADLLSRFTICFDDPHALEEELSQYRTLTRADLLEVAWQQLAPEQAAVVTVVPRGAAR